MHCFVAIELTPAMRQPLIRLLQQLPRSREVRWCTEHQLHITLKFLGDVPDEQIPAICEALRETAAATAPYTIRLTQLGCFPSPHSPRVLWCGVDDAAAATAAWVQRADPLLAALGFEPEQRAFTPHITLGRSRSREGAGVLRRVLSECTPLPAVEMMVESLVLFESRLRPSGAEYHAVATFPFGAESEQ